MCARGFVYVALLGTGSLEGRDKRAARRDETRRTRKPGNRPRVVLSYLTGWKLSSKLHRASL